MHLALPRTSGVQVFVAAVFLATFHCEAAPKASPIDDLTWMVGNWKAELGGLELRFRAKWDEGRNFIVRDFIVTKNGKLLETVQLRIAYDPARQAIRCWAFENNGGIGEGSVRKDGESWVFESECVSPGGTKSTSKVTYSSISANGFTATSSIKRESGNTPTKSVDFTRDNSVAPDSEIATSDVNSSAEKAALLASPEWKELRRDYQDWLSVQKKYDQAALDDMKAELDNKIAAMSADELKEMMRDSEAKLQILLSPDAANAREVLGRLVAFKVHGDKEGWQNKHNDLVNMTARQLEQEMVRLQQKREAMSRSSAAAAAGRQMQIQAVQQQREEHQRALDRNAYNNGGYLW
jgi:hypothetical protein